MAHLDENLANLVGDEPFGVSAVVDWKGRTERHGDCTIRYPQTPIILRMQVPPAAARKALVDGLELQADVVIPLEVQISEGKEVIRDRDGRIDGMVERRFAQVRFADTAA